MSAAQLLWSSPRARSGARDAFPFAVGSLMVGLSFGITARSEGVEPLAAIVMTVLMYAGSAQFAILAVLAQGGSVLTALTATALVMARFIPMGIALAPSIRGGVLRRAVMAQALMDPSWALANRGHGRFDVHRLFGVAITQYVTFVIGAAVGVLVGGLIPSPEQLGIDAIFPAFFLALLVSELRDAEAGAVAIAGATIAVVLGLLAPAGLGILAASAVALVGLRRRPGVAA